MKFYACEFCGATIREDHVQQHIDWHEAIEQAVASPVAAELELAPWPERAEPAVPAIDGR